MERVAVRSSNVAEVGYDSATMTLEVMFVDGDVYQYFDVPEAIFAQLIQSDSIGRFLNANVKGSYRYSRL